MATHSCLFHPFNRTFACVTTITVLVFTPLAHGEGENPFLKQLEPVADAPPGAWWKESWRQSWVYKHQADFSLSVLATVEPGKVSWWEALLSGFAKQFAGELNLEVKGTSLAITSVPNKQNGEISLARYYPRVDIIRSIFRKPISDPTIIDKAITAIVNDEERSKNINGIMNWIAMSAVGAATATPSPTVLTTSIIAPFIKTVGTVIGKGADKLFKEQLNKHGIKSRQDGGIEIDPDSEILKKTDLTQIASNLCNLAMQLNESFERRMFYIRASEKSGKALDIREIYDSKELQTTLSTADEKRQNKDSAKDIHEWLIQKFQSYPEPDKIVHGVIQRETFILSSEIFDFKERHPGDTWVVQATFFNSFLHPNLNGEFRGNVVLRYVRDAKIPDRDNPNEYFEAREIEILYKGRVGETTYESTLEYKEPKFAAKLRSDTEGVIFIDKNGDYLRQANLIMSSDVSAGLPDIKILEGLKAQGKSQFEVRYTCSGAPSEI